MAAHSACDFGGGKAEKLALAKYRQTIWQGRVLNSQFTDEELRSQGRCPLTPEEIGLLLAALGFDNSTRLYLASHKVLCPGNFGFAMFSSPLAFFSQLLHIYGALSPQFIRQMATYFRYMVGKLGFPPYESCSH